MDFDKLAIISCEHCGWPVYDSIEKGCTAANCSMRPMPPWRADIAEANKTARDLRSLGSEKLTDSEAVLVFRFRDHGLHPCDARESRELVIVKERS